MAILCQVWSWGSAWHLTLEGHLQYVTGGWISKPAKFVNVLEGCVVDDKAVEILENSVFVKSLRAQRNLVVDVRCKHAFFKSHHILDSEKAICCQHQPTVCRHLRQTSVGIATTGDDGNRICDITPQSYITDPQVTSFWHQKSKLQQRRWAEGDKYCCTLVRSFSIDVIEDQKLKHSSRLSSGSKQSKQLSEKGKYTWFILKSLRYGLRGAREIRLQMGDTCYF